MLAGIKKLFERPPVPPAPAYNYLEADIPITQRLDDKLGRHRFAAQMADIIRRVPSGSNSFAIGICGPWGAGKTSLLALIREQLEQGPDKDKFILLPFSPWLFNDIDSLVAHFFNLLENKFSTINRTLAIELKNYAAAIGKSLRIEDFGLLCKYLLSPRPACGVNAFTMKIDQCKRGGVHRVIGTLLALVGLLITLAGLVYSKRECLP